MMILNLKKVFLARGIAHPFKFLVKSGINPHTAHRLLNQKTAALKLTHLEKVCVLLNCTPHDFLEWIPTDLLDDRPDHPLQAIRRKEKTLEIAKSLAAVPLEQMEEVQAFLDGLKKRARAE